MGAGFSHVKVHRRSVMEARVDRNGARSRSGVWPRCAVVTSELTDASRRACEHQVNNRRQMSLSVLVHGQPIADLPFLELYHGSTARSACAQCFRFTGI